MRVIIPSGQHATKRMVQRGVSAADIHHAVENAVMTTDTREGIMYVGPGITRSALLKVWVLRHPRNPDAVTVKSVAWKDQDDD